ncbi:MAG: hypothetical protein GX610_06790 [Rhodococcus sp.]|nr:hypothetical protein [Rhodococcus sp. (in: high G+C Gram-positive bacteria)]
MELDVEAVNRAGSGFADTADHLVRAAASARSMTFGGSRAGRDYSAEGDALRDNVQRMAAALEAWSAGSRSFGESVHDATARTVTTDAMNATTLDGIAP